MIPIDDVSRLYLIAGLRLGQDVEVLVDAYYGPVELREEARRVEDVAAVLDELDAGIATIEDEGRRRYLEAQARALRTVARANAGEEIPYRERVWLLYGIHPVWTDEGIFNEAHAAIDDLLPGTESLAERAIAFRRRFERPAATLLPVIERVSEDLRARTARLVGLPDGEGVEYEIVTGQLWSGYNWYRGNLRSLVQINADHPIVVVDLPSYLAHESYPGHHTEGVHKEVHLVWERQYGEALIALLTSPQAVLSEGIAMNALEQVVPTEERAAWLERQVLAPAGLPLEGERLVALSRTMRDLEAVSANAALMYHAGSADHDDVVAYLQRFALMEPVRAATLARFIEDEQDGLYIHSYGRGATLVRDYLERAPDRAAFGELLGGQWTPDAL